MCDYSLEMYASRPARESEKYVTTRFPSGSIGLAEPGDCTTAVCVLPGMKLKLKGISVDVQEKHDLSAEEVVEFTQLDGPGYRDGIVFANGKKLLLQQIGSGVGAELVMVKPNIIELDTDPGFAPTVNIKESLEKRDNTVLPPLVTGPGEPLDNRWPTPAAAEVVWGAEDVLEPVG